jgi:alanyl-tRNA synthetase
VALKMQKKGLLSHSELKRKYLEFFKERGHSIIPSAPLIPEHDPSVLFTTSGMHPLVPYLLGQPHPQGTRLADVQKCIRTTDIDDVGDDTHLTFFEMLGNWSLGDYFKKEAITWSFEFLTKVLNLDPKKLHVTVFAGDKDAPRDEEAASIWKSLEIPEKRIYYFPKEDNWWIQSINLGPCGPDTEMFIDTGKPKCGPDCKPGCHCGKYFEVWNDVFMQYNRTKEGIYEPLKQKNVDTGMGVERTLAMIHGLKSVYETDIFLPLLRIVQDTSISYKERSARIIVDHVRAATFILGDERGISPSNVGQGYILRRLIRRAIRHARLIGAGEGLIQKLSSEIINISEADYPFLNEKRDFIINELTNEEKKFLNTIEKGLKAFDKLVSNESISGKNAFLLFQSYGFPIEITKEIAEEKGIRLDLIGYEEEFKKHQEISRVGAEKQFKGGLADTSMESIKLHTATHLLGEALRRILSNEIKQKGSNITAERLRFDFNFGRKVTPEELKRVEALVNEQINQGLPVIKEEMTFEEAQKTGAQAEFEQKYSEYVFVYSIGDFSKEICGGPHVNNTNELGAFKILKEEAVAAGVRRIKAVLKS